MMRSFGESLGAIVAPALDVCPAAGLVVGVHVRGRSRVYGFAARGARDRIPDGTTIHEIGSITKVLTTSLLATLVVEQRIRLDDPVRGFLPELSRFPLEITPRRLATHTSGLPRLPTDRRLTLTAVKNPKNPYVGYTTDDLFRWLADYTTAPSSDRGVTYSNLGVALLGHVCARAAGSSYEEAVERRIAQPLGLRDTGVTVPPDKLARLAAPHNWRGEPASSWDLPAFVGAGALRSTADDMLRFLGANVDPERWFPSLALCHDVQIADPCFVASGLITEIARAYGFELAVSAVAPSNEQLQAGRFRMALGWLRTIDDDGDDIHWHNGATGGYRAFAGFSKGGRTAVVVLANRGGTLGDTSVDDIGFGVLRLLSVAPPEFEAQS
jgi:D-alanyl-D-alanine-carboxypeptidase/D-alanyl-D-alanine-endopeptidase